MRKFTATEIDLCKKIAEKAEKGKTNEEANPIYMTKGSYYYKAGFDKVMLFEGEGLNFLGALTVGAIPLWQEHDCLGWLREKGLRCFHLDDVEGDYYVRVINHQDSIAIAEYGDTPLETLLRAVLAVMKEKP